jgi:hypothetical protein
VDFPKIGFPAMQFALATAWTGTVNARRDLANLHPFFKLSESD